VGMRLLKTVRKTKRRPLLPVLRTGNADGRLYPQILKIHPCRWVLPPPLAEAKASLQIPCHGWRQGEEAWIGGVAPKRGVLRSPIPPSVRGRTAVDQLPECGEGGVPASCAKAKSGKESVASATSSKRRF